MKKNRIVLLIVFISISLLGIILLQGYWIKNAIDTYEKHESGSVFKVTNADTADANDNSTANWSNITGSQFLGSVSDIEFGKDENHLFVTFHNYGVENIFYSEDGGQSWTEKEGNLPDIPVRCILQNPLSLNEVIIGTELGVWYTKNFESDNPDWSRANSGMSDVRITDLDER